MWKRVLIASAFFASAITALFGGEVFAEEGNTATLKNVGAGSRICIYGAQEYDGSLLTADVSNDSFETQVVFGDDSINSGYYRCKELNLPIGTYSARLNMPMGVYSFRYSSSREYDAVTFYSESSIGILRYLYSFGSSSTAVAGDEEDGDDVALVADSVCDEGGLPVEVANLAVLLFARADAGGEVEKAVLACESVFEGVDVGSVAVYFVDGDKERRGAGEVEEEVVYGEFDVLTVSANGGHNGKAIGTAEGMVASDNGVAFFRDVVRVDDYNFGIQVAGVVAFKKGMDEVESELVTGTVDG